MYKKLVVVCVALVVISYGFVGASNTPQAPLEHLQSPNSDTAGRLAKTDEQTDVAFLNSIAHAKRPSYLSMGDSISLCYFPYLKKALTKKYSIDRIPHNGASTELGMTNIDAYLKNGPYDLITFNWGLHDLIHVKLKTPKRTIIRYRTPVNVYKKRLRALTKKLAASGAKLVWVNTTPVLDSERYNAADVAPYNAVAEQVMKEMGVHVIDLKRSKYRKKPIKHKDDGLHFTRETCLEFSKIISAELRHLN